MSNHVEIKAEISVLHILPCILPRLDSKKNKIKWCRARRTCSYSKVGFIEVTYNIHVGIRLDVRACSSLALIVNHIYTFSPHGWVLREPKTRKEKKRKKKRKKPCGKQDLKRLKKTSAIHYLVYDPRSYNAKWGRVSPWEPIGRVGLSGSRPQIQAGHDRDLNRDCHRLRVAGLENHR